MATTLDRHPETIQDVAAHLRPRLVTIDAARKYMGGISDRTFFSVRAKYAIKAVHLLPDGKPLFDLAELDRAIEASARTTVATKVKSEAN